MRRTQEDIDRQIAGLKRVKDTVPEYSRFGDPNHKSIDAQISILSKEKNMSFYEPSFIDDNEEEEEEESEEKYIYDEALLAFNWLNGNYDEDLFEL